MNDDLYKRYIPSCDLGDELLPVSLRLKPEDSKYIMALQLLSQDILRSHAIAKEVIAQPETVLARYGYDGKINLDDSLTKIIIALGNDEINLAIQNKDMSKFISLCREYGIMSEKNQSDLLSDKFYKEQITKIQQHPLSRGNVESSRIEPEAAIFFVAGVVAVAAIAVVVVAGVGVAWNVGAAYNTYTSVNLSSIHDRVPTLTKQDLTAIDIITLKRIDGYHLINDYYDDTINVGLEVIREMHPEISETYTEDELRQLLYVNIARNANK